MNEMLDKLLALELPEPATAKVEIKRLSRALGEPYVVTLKELPYGRVAKLSRMEEGDVQYVVEGHADPRLTDPRFYEGKMQCATPAEAAKKLYNAGEIRRMARTLDRLNGFGGDAVEDVKKN